MSTPPIGSPIKRHYTLLYTRKPATFQSGYNKCRNVILLEMTHDNSRHVIFER